MSSPLRTFSVRGLAAPSAARLRSRALARSAVAFAASSVAPIWMIQPLPRGRLLSSSAPARGARAGSEAAASASLGFIGGVGGALRPPSSEYGAKEGRGDDQAAPEIREGRCQERHL